jgi:hypothetical protein
VSFCNPEETKRLCWIISDVPWSGGERVPSEDKEIEVEE